MCCFGEHLCNRPSRNLVSLLTDSKPSSSTSLYIWDMYAPRFSTKLNPYTFISKANANYSILLRQLLTVKVRSFGHPCWVVWSPCWQAQQNAAWPAQTIERHPTRPMHNRSSYQGLLTNLMGFKFPSQQILDLPTNGSVYALEPIKVAQATCI